MISEEQLQEWQRLANEATEGPWKRCGLDGVMSMSDDADPIIVSCYSTVITQQSKNADFIAAAREAVPQLITEVRRYNLLQKQFVETCENLVQTRREADWLASYFVDICAFPEKECKDSAEELCTLCWRKKARKAVQDDK